MGVKLTERQAFRPLVARCSLWSRLERGLAKWQLWARNRNATFAQPWTDHLEKSLNFQQAYAALESLIHSLPSLFSDVTVNFALGENRPAIGNWLDPLNLGLLATGDGVGLQERGVLFWLAGRRDYLYRKGYQKQSASPSMGPCENPAGRA